MIWAWVARPRREERVEAADSSRAARELGVRKFPKQLDGRDIFSQNRPFPGRISSQHCR